MMDFSCQVPAGRGKAQPLRVMAGGNIGLPTTTYAYDAPSITSITPTTGPLRGNISMTIQGQNFGTDLSDSDTVTIGGRLCPIEFTSFRTIICRVPAGIGGSLNVNVTILDQSAIASQKFSYDVPILDSVFPNKLSNNESFAILKGRNLGNNTSQIVIQLRHPNGTIYSACSSVSILSGEPENGIINW
ncbi:hypothetical protein BKA69DRAFT_704064 [Paraphysoderma sedebokerense]|nr:hypothetical protein BKA69DRAFT_704064 [Paraphysoderma sedebokerense]